MWRLGRGCGRPLTPSPQARDVNTELWVRNLQAIQLCGFPHFSEFHSPCQPRLDLVPSRGDLPRVRGGQDRKEGAQVDHVRTCFSAARRIRLHRYRFAPSSKKEMGPAYRDTESADFRGLQHIATVCEPSATVSAVNPRLKQFATDCNNHRQRRQRPDSQRPGSGT